MTTTLTWRFFKKSRMLCFSSQTHLWRAGDIIFWVMDVYDFTSIQSMSVWNVSWVLQAWQLNKNMKLWSFLKLLVKENKLKKFIFTRLTTCAKTSQTKFETQRNQLSQAGASADTPMNSCEIAKDSISVEMCLCRTGTLKLQQIERILTKEMIKDGSCWMIAGFTSTVLWILVSVQRGTH